MKTRILLTLAAIAAYSFAGFLWRLIESPVRGAATAAQLDDTMHSYMAAKAITDNAPEKIGTLILILVISAIWFLPSRTKTPAK